MHILLRLHVRLGRTEDEIQCNQYQAQGNALHGSEGHIADIPAAKIIEHKGQGVAQDCLEGDCEQTPFAASHFPVAGCHGYQAGRVEQIQDHVRESGHRRHEFT